MCRSETKRDGLAQTHAMGLALICALLSLGACASTEPDGAFAQPPPPPAYGPPTPQAYPPPMAYAPPEPYAPPMNYQPMVRPLPPGLLAAPPSNAGPGECFAKVRVAGEPISQPPAQPHAVWMLTPPAPGQATPMWCLYLEPGAQPPPIFSPERFGWIRVICDQDANKTAVRHVQRRLKTWGYYRGAETGAFDNPTASAVRRFQMERRIEHGGYLSYTTMAALDGPPQAVAPSFAPPNFPHGPPPGPYGAPRFAPPAWPQGGPPVWPCAAQACISPGAGAVDTGRPPYLSWPDKSRY